MRQPIRSFVLRAGRLTEAQKRALEHLLPRYGASLETLGDPAALFGRRAPLVIEIGIGNGDNLVAQAARNPAINHLGFEVHRPGIGHALNAVATAGLRNVRIAALDVIEGLAALPDNSLDGVSIYFPDPWPKKRHHKRRLVDKGFLERLAKRVKRSATCCFATDDADYAATVLELIDATPGWMNLAGRRRYAPRQRTRIVTRFESRALTARRPVRDILFARSSLDS